MNANLVGDLVFVFDQLDALSMAQHKLEFPAPACKNCDGWGELEPNPEPGSGRHRKCVACNGTGWAASDNQAER